MSSHALPLRELHCQELFAEAAHARRLDHLVPAVAAETSGAYRRLADLRQRVVTAVVLLRPAPQLPSHAAAQ